MSFELPGVLAFEPEDLSPEQESMIKRSIMFHLMVP